MPDRQFLLGALLVIYLVFGRNQFTDLGVEFVDLVTFYSLQ